MAAADAGAVVGRAAGAVSGGPRVLLLTPDYPPARGGIQYLLHGIVRHARRVRFRVVTLAYGAGAVDDDEGVRTRRVSSWGPRSGALGRLNATALAEARRWRPDVVLSGHIVLAPAARLRPRVQRPKRGSRANAMLRRCSRSTQSRRRARCEVLGV